MVRKRWSEFFLYLFRVFVLLVLLAVVLPTIAGICQNWMSSFFDHHRKPSGNPMRVEESVKGSLPTGIAVKLFPE